MLDGSKAAGECDLGHREFGLLHIFMRPLQTQMQVMLRHAHAMRCTEMPLQLTIRQADPCGKLAAGQRVLQRLVHDGFRCPGTALGSLNSGSWGGFGLILHDQLQGHFIGQCR